MVDTGTKSEAQQSLFVYVKDVNTGKITRVAIPADVQIGLAGNPAELQLLGRLSLTPTIYTVDASNNGVVNINNHDAIAGISLVTRPSTNRIKAYLPPGPREGQLHFIKDLSGTSATTPIDVYPAPGYKIDDQTFRTLSDAYGSLALSWINGQWRMLVAGMGISGGGGPSPAAVSGSNAQISSLLSASFITAVPELALSQSRYALAGDGITITDNGPEASIVWSLTPEPSPGLTIDGLQFKLPALSGLITGGPGGRNGISCATLDTTTVTLGGKPGVIYDVLLRFRGVVETKLYAGGWSDSANPFFQIGGVPIDDVEYTSFANVYSLSVSSPSATYYLNRHPVNVRVRPIDYIQNIPVEGGASLTITATTSDPGELANDSTNGGPYTVAGVTSSIVQPYNGQFIVINYVTSSVSTVAGKVFIENNGYLLPSGAYPIINAVSGVHAQDSGDGYTALLSIDNNVVATISGSTFTGAVLGSVSGGFTGSLTRLRSGDAFITGLGSVTVTTSSSGQVLISGSGGSGGGGSSTTNITNASQVFLGSPRVTPPDANTVLYYPLDEIAHGPWVNSGSGGTLDLSAFGSVNTINGLFGKSIDMDGASAGGLTSANTSVGEIASNITVSGWVKPRSYPNFVEMMVKAYRNNNTWASPFVSVFVEITQASGDGRWAAGVNIAGTVYGPTITSSWGKIYADEWSFVAMTFDGTTVSLYKNGDLAGTLTVPGAPAVVDYGTHGPWYLGGNPVSGEDIDGQVDDVRVESVTRSAAYLSAMYLNGIGSYTTNAFSGSLNQFVSGTWRDAGSKFVTTASVSVDSLNRTADQIGTDVFFYVSGSAGVASGSGRKVAVFGGDLIVSGSVTMAGSILSASTVLNIVQAGGTKVSSSLGVFTISSSIGAYASASYLVVALDAQSPNERKLTAGTGINLTDFGPGGNLTISATGGGGGGGSSVWSDSGAGIYVTSSVSVDSVTAPASIHGTDIFFYVSGSTDLASGSDRHVAVFGGDVISSGTITTTAGASLRDPDVKLLMHYDGTSGSSDFKDSSNYPLSFGSTGTVQLSNAQAKFGATSLSLNGVNTNFLSSSNSKISFGRNNFTIEGWFWFNANNTGYQPLFCFATNADQQGPIIILESNNTLTAYASSTAGSWAYFLTTALVPTVGVWTHIALVGEGNSWLKLYVDGVLVGSSQVSYDLHTANKVYPGYYQFFPGAPRTFDGFIDEVRITVGRCQYTGSFVRPTAPFVY